MAELQLQVQNGLWQTYLVYLKDNASPVTTAEYLHIPSWCKVLNEVDHHNPRACWIIFKIYILKCNCWTFLSLLGIYIEVLSTFLLVLCRKKDRAVGKKTKKMCLSVVDVILNVPASFGAGSMSMPAGFGNTSSYCLPTSYSGTFQQAFPGHAPYAQPSAYHQQPNGEFRGGFASHKCALCVCLSVSLGEF